MLGSSHLVYMRLGSAIHIKTQHHNFKQKMLLLPKFHTYIQFYISIVIKETKCLEFATNVPVEADLKAS